MVKVGSVVSQWEWGRLYVAARRILDRENGTRLFCKFSACLWFEATAMMPWSVEPQVCSLVGRKLRHGKNLCSTNSLGAGVERSRLCSPVCFV